MTGGAYVPACDNSLNCAENERDAGCGLCRGSRRRRWREGCIG